MKNLVLALLFLPLAAFAKPSGEIVNTNIQLEATTIARSLVEVLKLNEMEYIKVRELTAQHIMGMNDIADYYQYDVDMKAKKMAAAKSAYERRLKYILNSQ